MRGVIGMASVRGPGIQHHQFRFGGAHKPNEDEMMSMTSLDKCCSTEEATVCSLCRDYGCATVALLSILASFFLGKYRRTGACCS
jgi:hypothetical protein